jgi:Holliday junction DNA helicase RuvB
MLVGNEVIMEETTKEAAMEALSSMEIDKLGLDSIDRRLLTTMIRNYNGGPVGLETISAAIGEESVTIEDVYEPYLMQIGFLARTPRGRQVTPAGYEHLGIKFNPNGSADTAQIKFD